MLGSVVRRKTLPQPTASFFSKSFHQSLAGVSTQVVHDQMDGIGLRIARRDIQQVISKLGRAASRSHLVKCRPALGSIPQNTLAVPQRLNSLSRRATLPGFIAIGERISACSTTGFSSMQTTGARWQRGFSYSRSTSSMRAMYSSSSSPTHHIFFPPRLQFVAFQQHPDGLSPDSRYQLAFDYLFGQQAHRPARPTRRRLTTSHGNDALSLFPIQSPSCPQSEASYRRAPTRPADSACRSATPLWPKSPNWQPPRAWTVLYPSVVGPSSQHRPHWLQPAAQQPIQLLPIPPGKLNPKCFASTHAIAMKPDTVHGKCIS